MFLNIRFEYRQKQLMVAKTPYRRRLGALVKAVATNNAIDSEGFLFISSFLFVLFLAGNHSCVNISCVKSCTTEKRRCRLKWSRMYIERVKFPRWKQNRERRVFVLSCPNSQRTYSRFVRNEFAHYTTQSTRFFLLSFSLYILVRSTVLF